MHARALVLTAGLAVVFSAAANAVEEKTEIPKEMKGLPLVYSDSFDAGRDNWTETDPTAWKIEDEAGNKVFSLFQASKYEPPVRSPNNIARIKDLNVSDFVLEVRMKQTGREYGHRDMCLFFGYNDPSHFYYAHLATASDEHANSIFLVNGEPRVSIAQERTSGTKWTDTYHVLRIERDTEAGTIFVYFDDMAKPVFKTVDKTFLSGGIGFGSFDDTGNIDDVRVWGKKVEANKP
ncbi:MAG: hypothetical protein IT364_06455 [Candidatus Hydrogenedentes bacterium]|nr:hypothetical protein [Candidatus Hydrogenedentota bacterium]